MKKLLAMVLALVMTLSLAVSANAAFKDAKDVDDTFAEAVEVLNGMKVFKGYEDGSFQPKGDITRAEVAAIVYRIYTSDVKDTYVKNYETYNKFSDMAGAGWAKGYIGYCANAALVKGYPNGTFVPSGKVTGYEVLAMILRAVGYDQNNEFTGADWSIHVAQIAEQNKILKNVKGIDLNKAATRELVAELLFQAIQVPMVTYTAAFGYQNVSLGGDKLIKDNVSLGSKNFYLKSEDSNDDWGRPTKVWLNSKSGAEYATIAIAPDAAFQVATSECDICEALGEKKSAEIVEIYDNGKLTKDTDKYTATATKSMKGAQGQQIEYYNVDTGKYRMVVIDTYLAQVNEVVTEKTDGKSHIVRDAYLDLDVYNVGYQQKAATYYVKGNDYAEGDWVLVNVNKAETVKIILTSNKAATETPLVEIVGKAESFDGIQTEIYYKSNQHTIDKKDYNDAVKFFLDDAGEDGTVTFTWFLDQFGNLIGDIAIDNTNYAILKNINWETGKPGYAEATLVYMDGTEGTVKVDSIDGVPYDSACKELCGDFAAVNDNAVPTLNDSEKSNRFEDQKAYMSSDTTYTGNYDGMALFMVETNKDGTVNLQGIELEKSGQRIAKQYVYYLDNATIKTDVGTISVENGTATNGVKKLALDNNTKFIVRETKDGEYVYTQYTLKTLPDYAAESVALYYTMNGNFVNRVYIKHALDQGEFADYIFVPSNAEKYIKRIPGEAAWQAYVYINGELEWIETTENNAKTLAENTGKLFHVESWDKSVDSDFYGRCDKIDLVNEANDSGAWKLASESDYITKWDINADGDTIVSDSTVWRLNDKTVIVTADGTEMTMSDLSKIGSREFEGLGIWVISAKADYEGVASYVYVGEKLSDDASAKGAYTYTTVDSKTANGVMTFEKNDFTKTLENDATVGTATITANDKNASVDYNDGWLVNLDGGDFYVANYVDKTNALTSGQKYSVTVTAEDGVTTATYTYTITNGKITAAPDLTSFYGYQVKAYDGNLAGNETYRTVWFTEGSTIELSKLAAISTTGKVTTFETWDDAANAWIPVTGNLTVSEDVDTTWVRVTVELNGTNYLFVLNTIYRNVI